MSLSAVVVDVLRGATVEGSHVRLNCSQLERPVYEGVNEVLTRLGGKWKGGKTRAHYFEHYDPKPLLAAVVASEKMPDKNPLAFFPTPAPVVDQMLMMAATALACPGVQVLEPSAGTGRIVDAVRLLNPSAQLTVVELHDLNAAVLRGKGYEVHEQDFTTFEGGPFDVVLMNPPFSVQGDKLAYITHITRAWEMCSGVLVAIAPPGFTFRQDKKSKAFADLVDDHGDHFLLSPGSFKSSGTGIATELVTLRR